MSRKTQKTEEELKREMVLCQMFKPYACKKLLRQHGNNSYDCNASSSRQYPPQTIAAESCDAPKKQLDKNEAIESQLTEAIEAPLPDDDDELNWIDKNEEALEAEERERRKKRRQGGKTVLHVERANSSKHSNYDDYPSSSGNEDVKLEKSAVKDKMDRITKDNIANSTDMKRATDKKVTKAKEKKSRSPPNKEEFNAGADDEEPPYKGNRWVVDIEKYRKRDPIPKMENELLIAGEISMERVIQIKKERFEKELANMTNCLINFDEEETLSEKPESPKAVEKPKTSKESEKPKLTILDEEVPELPIAALIDVDKSEPNSPSEASSDETPLKATSSSPTKDVHVPASSLNIGPLTDKLSRLPAASSPYFDECEIPEWSTEIGMSLPSYPPPDIPREVYGDEGFEIDGEISQNIQPNEPELECEVFPSSLDSDTVIIYTACYDKIQSIKYPKSYCEIEHFVEYSIRNPPDINGMKHSENPFDDLIQVAYEYTDRKKYLPLMPPIALDIDVKYEYSTLIRDTNGLQRPVYIEACGVSQVVNGMEDEYPHLPIIAMEQLIELVVLFTLRGHKATVIIPNIYMTNTAFEISLPHIVHILKELGTLAIVHRHPGTKEYRKIVSSIVESDNGCLVSNLQFIYPVDNIVMRQKFDYGEFLDEPMKLPLLEPHYEKGENGFELFHFKGYAAISVDEKLTNLENQTFTLLTDVKFYSIVTAYHYPYLSYEFTFDQQVISVDRLAQFVQLNKSLQYGAQVLLLINKLFHINIQQSRIHW